MSFLKEAERWKNDTDSVLYKEVTSRQFRVPFAVFDEL